MQMEAITSDECFERSNPGPYFPLTWYREPHLTQVIGRKLEPGTVCTFNVTILPINRFSPPLDEVSASCTVDGKINHNNNQQNFIVYTLTHRLGSLTTNSM